MRKSTGRELIDCIRLYPFSVEKYSLPFLPHPVSIFWAFLHFFFLTCVVNSNIVSPQTNSVVAQTPKRQRLNTTPGDVSGLISKSCLLAPRNLGTSNGTGVFYVALLVG